MATILVIDDDELYRTMEEFALRTQGYTVICAVDGNEGLDILGRMPIDLVVTDIVMPNCEGIETIQRIQGLAAEPKVIAISGGGRHDDGEVYLRMASTFGVHGVLRKPFRPQDLVALVESILPAAPVPHPESQTASSQA